MKENNEMSEPRRWMDYGTSGVMPPVEVVAAADYDALRARVAELEADAAGFHKVMELLRNTRLGHGTCVPRSRRACSHCNAIDDIASMLGNYKGPRIFATGLSANKSPQ